NKSGVPSMASRGRCARSNIRSGCGLSEYRIRAATLKARPRSAVSNDRIACDRITEAVRRSRQITSTSSLATTAATILRLIENERILFPEGVSMSANRVNQLVASPIFEFPPQTRNVDFDDVAESLPIEVI